MSRKNRFFNLFVLCPIFLGFVFCGCVFGQSVSEEAKKHFDRGMAAVEMAKSPDDYAAAINEFEQAARLAPDWPDVYYNLGKVQETAEKFNDAVKSFRQYLRLAPDAEDAEEIKSFINKLEYKQDQEEGVKRVYEMMASGIYERKQVDQKKLSGKEGGSPLWNFRIVSGEMQVSNSWYVEQMSGAVYSPQLHPPIPRQWEPVKVNGRFYEYTYSYYMDINWGYVVRDDHEVKGEIISIDPPRVKEIVKLSITWRVPFVENPYPWSDYGGVSEYIYELIAEGAGINAKDPKPIIKGSTTPLHNAATWGNMERAVRLIAEGADVNARDEIGQTPLSLAFIFDHRDVAELLISKGADMNAEDIFGNTPQMFTETNKAKDVKGKGQERKETVDINAKNENGNTKLHMQVILCSDHNVDATMNSIRELIDQGADVNAKNNFGQTPLDNVAWSLSLLPLNEIDLAKLLISKGADINSPLINAAAHNKKALAEYLLAKGANISTKDEHGCTPLHAAIGDGIEECREVSELLITKGADINAKDNNGDTPLHKAVWKCHKEIVELLIVKGAEIDAKNEFGSTPLHDAARIGETEMVELLIAKGADVNAKNKEGQTTLGVAAAHGRKNVVELLIAKGANINDIVDDIGSMALHLAAGNGQKAVAELLIAKGADINAKDKNGKTPLQLAENSNKKNVADLLRKHGAK